MTARACALALSCAAAGALATGCAISTGATLAIATGRVAEAGTDVAIPDAFVVLAGYEATTGPDGMFLIENIRVPEKKESTLTVSRDRFRTYDEVFRFDAPGDLQIQLEAVQTPGASGTLDGRVRDDTTETGIAGAKVTARTDLGGIAVDEQSAHTSNAGNWQISGIPIGYCTVEALAAGYLPARLEVDVQPGQGSNRFITIDLIEGTRRVTVTGRVFDIETQAPVAGAVVGDDESARTTTTDEMGNYSLDDVLVGSRTFRANADGYDPAFVTRLILADPPAVDIGMSRAVGDPPPAPGTISGTVTVVGAEDSSGVDVFARDGTSGDVIARMTTGPGGGFAFLVPPGSYRISALKAGYKPAEVLVTYSFGVPVRGVSLVLQPED